MSIIQDFKAFALKGNVIDMAVGVIIGSAFGKIVSSLVNDVLMPVIGMLTGNIDFTNLSFQLGEGENAAVLKYGQFIQNVTDFLIIAICIFFMVKGISALSRKKEEVKEEPAPAPEPTPSAEEKLLTEIRDLLKK